MRENMEPGESAGKLFGEDVQSKNTGGERRAAQRGPFLGAVWLQHVCITYAVMTFIRIGFCHHFTLKPVCIDAVDNESHQAWQHLPHFFPCLQYRQYIVQQLLRAILDLAK